MRKTKSNFWVYNWIINIILSLVIIYIIFFSIKITLFLFFLNLKLLSVNKTFDKLVKYDIIITGSVISNLLLLVLPFFVFMYIFLYFITY